MATAVGTSIELRQDSFDEYKREQARISRHRLYPVTLFYTAYAVIVLAFAFRSPHGDVNSGV